MHALVGPAVQAPEFAQVRRRLFRQLLESLLYEGMLAARPLGDDHHAVDGTDEQGRAVSYRFTMRRYHGFGRIRLGTEPVVRCVGGERAEAESLTRFLADIRAQLGADDGRVAQFSRELEHTLINDAVAQHVREQRGDVLASSSYDALEGAVMDGHPYHPAYKSRIGFSVEDNLAWGPEFAAPIRPLWLAARRGISVATSSAEVEEGSFLRDQLGQARDGFIERIRQAGGDPADYVLVPVHPWQWRQQIAHGFAPQLRDGDLIVLGEDPHDHFAQQSIRTLACRDVPQRPYVKLSLSILNTSTTRVLAPHTVSNAARMSDWLSGIVDSDPYLRDELRLILLGEVMGVAVDPEPASELVREDTYGVLACIWRDNLHRHLDEGEQAVPCTGLIARERDGTPLIDPWVRERGVREWTRELLAVCVPPLIHLLQGHGVAVEVHAQNMVLVHDRGRPVRLALRDFHDGVRFSRAHLAEPARCPELAGTPPHHVNRNSFVETDELDLVTDFVLDAFFFINLGELAMFLADAYDHPERDFWAVAREIIQAYQRRFPELDHRFSLFDVGKPILDVERLTARRLLPDTELRLHAVPNPLHEPTTGQGL